MKNCDITVRVEPETITLIFKASFQELSVKLDKETTTDLLAALIQGVRTMDDMQEKVTP